ncbi:ABC transporter permease [Microbacterium karelineae]|uniref:ABC transporter permease n=1 Tax=Microbacterium karelineae TaxID=2654283 RepID=UPI0027D2EAC8|nr:ABC transporter permease [Microbacterium karelineae]
MDATRRAATREKSGGRRMNVFASALAWLGDAANWGGPAGIAARATEHLAYSGLTLAIAVAIAVPIGVWVGHTGRGRDVVVPLTGALRALPTLGLVTLLALLMGSGLLPPLLALVILAIPPILAGTYSGIEAIAPETRGAARAVGFTTAQTVWQVELPLALPLIAGGVRSAALQVIATWTVAAFLPLGGLGRFLIDGLAVRDYAQMLGGSLIVIALALVADLAFAAVERALTPRGVRGSHYRGSRRRARTSDTEIRKAHAS